MYLVRNAACRGDICLPPSVRFNRLGPPSLTGMKEVRSVGVIGAPVGLSVPVGASTLPRVAPGPCPRSPASRRAFCILVIFCAVRSAMSVYHRRL